MTHGSRSELVFPSDSSHNKLQDVPLDIPEPHEIMKGVKSSIELVQKPEQQEEPKKMAVSEHISHHIFNQESED